MILVTGVSGALGSAILGGLRAVEGLEVVAGSHGGGDGVRRVDFDRPETLAEGFAGVDVLMFVSAGYAEDDVVLARHAAAISAAAKAGVRHVVYTSLAASGERFTIALPHRWTESRLAEAPFDVTVLRNGLYTEVPVGLALAGAESVAESGVFVAPFGDGRMPVVARDDLAAAAVRVTAEIQSDLAAGGASRHAGRTYELEGGGGIGGREIAEAFTEVLGRPIGYRTMPLGDLRPLLAAAGLEAYQVAHSISMFSCVNAGLLEAGKSDLPAFVESPRAASDLLLEAVKSALAR
jgi:NAD(P)H dehydrogenase (quinone)